MHRLWILSLLVVITTLVPYSWASASHELVKRADNGEDNAGAGRGRQQDAMNAPNIRPRRTGRVVIRREDERRMHPSEASAYGLGCLLILRAIYAYLLPIYSMEPPSALFISGVSVLVFTWLMSGRLHVVNGAVVNGNLEGIVRFVQHAYTLGTDRRLVDEDIRGDFEITMGDPVPEIVAAPRRMDHRWATTDGASTSARPRIGVPSHDSSLTEGSGMNSGVTRGDRGSSSMDLRAPSGSSVRSRGKGKAH
ncbi:hypothetical protein SeLEV6574_g03654 [Synchytrium endobioticum]|uniref:Uncharacterized protein n=3 Tax=Synchytrium endobioticum TaxID=286115 RepID=A0A507D2U8_9FUNG|nr:hypothetical protein SeLEV6574_g03654 [Synchytrium endobioticum]